MNPKDIKKKIKSFAHEEFNKDEFLNISKINKCIAEGKDLFNREQKYSKIDLDKSFPKYIFDNELKLKDWII